MSFTAILDRSGFNKEKGKALVKISANWCWDRIGSSLMKPAASFSRTKWLSISICFVLSWKVGLEAMLIAAWLSQKRSACVETSTWKSFNNWCIHINSLVVEANARYSASAEDLKIVVCFLAFHETKELPMTMQKPVTDFLVSKQDLQSASEMAFTWMEEEEEKKYKPWLGSIWDI